MKHRDISAKVLRSSEAFVTINGEDFFVDDWLKCTRQSDSGRPWVIVTAFQDAGEQGVVLRDGVFTKRIYTMTEFSKMIRAGEFYRIEKPLFKIGQLFKNCYTEKEIRIMEVPFAPNDKDGEYVYFVRHFTPSFGYNFDCITEKELCDLYKTEGMEMK